MHRIGFVLPVFLAACSSGGPVTPGPDGGGSLCEQQLVPACANTPPVYDEVGSECQLAPEALGWIPPQPKCCVGETAYGVCTSKAEPGMDGCSIQYPDVSCRSGRCIQSPDDPPGFGCCSTNGMKCE